MLRTAGGERASDALSRLQSCSDDDFVRAVAEEVVVDEQVSISANWPANDFVEST